MAILIALLTVAATASGGLLALRSHQRLHLVLGLSAGLLLGLVSFDLLPEVFRIDTGTIGNIPTVAVAFVVGFLLLHILERASGAHEPLDSDLEDSLGHSHAVSTTGILGALGMVVHVFLDGVAVALAFHVSAAIGLAIALAVIAHAFSDGLNTVSLLIHHGHWQERARYLLVLDGSARTLGAALGTYVSISDRLLALYLAMFAGFLTYLATSHILPEAHSRHSSRLTLLATVLGVAFMFVVVSFMSSLG